MLHMRSGNQVAALLPLINRRLHPKNLPRVPARERSGAQN